MKKILSIFAITLLQSSVSLAQGIGDISIEPKSPSLNQPFKVTINSNGDTPACGLQINLGDGTTRDIRAEKFPVVVDHTYAKEGNFAIAVNGKMIMRGLSSMFPCAGDAKTLAVGIGSQNTNISSAQVLPSPPPATNSNPVAQLGNVMQGMQRDMDKLNQPQAQQPQAQQPQAQQPRPQVPQPTTNQVQANGPSVNDRSNRDLQWKEIKQKEAELMKEADQNGLKAATSSKTKFKVFSKKDQMSGVESIIARYEGSIGNGKATVDLFCDKDSLKSKTTFQGVTVPTTRSVSDGRKRLNGKISLDSFRQGEFSNVYEKIIGEVISGRVVLEEKIFGYTTLGKWTRIPSNPSIFFREDYKLADCPNAFSRDQCKGLDVRNTVEIVYDYAFEFTTSGGAFFVEMSPYDPAIKRVLDSCK